MNIGLIGAGALGQFLLEKINDEQFIPGYQITAVFDERQGDASKLTRLAKTFDFRIHHTLTSFLKESIDLVIECANVDVAEKYSKQIVHEKDLLIISVGALANGALYEQLQSIASEQERKLYIPAGAIGGLDVLRAAKVVNGLDRVELITRKPSHAFSLENLAQEQVIFSGPAKEAISQYPQNANIAITISLAGLGAEKTHVTIIADPSVDKNIHTLKAEGSFGKLTLTLENNPAPNNPKTSYLTALSILETIRSL